MAESTSTIATATSCGHLICSSANQQQINASCQGTRPFLSQGYVLFERREARSFQHCNRGTGLLAA